MAESAIYAGSPFDEYLRDTGTEEDVLQDSDAPAYGQPGPDSRASVSQRSDDADAVDPPPAAREAAAAAAPTPGPAQTASDPFADLLKYSLATSSLLSARLSDAISLYPPIDLAGPSKEQPGDSAEGRSRADEHQAHGDTAPEPRPPLEWGDRWDHAGETVWDRSAIGNAWQLTKWLAVPLLARVSAPRTDLQAREDPSDSTQRNIKASTSSAHADALGSVDRFVSASQELDLRVTRALGGIREVECITWGLGLSQPLPPISRMEAASHLANPVGGHTQHPRVPSPLGFAVTPRDLDDSPHFPVALNNARFTLKGIQGDLASATPEDLELERHEAEAARDRAEAEDRERRAREWEDGALSADSSSDWENDSTFGGVDRGTGLGTSASGKARPDSPPPPSSKRSSVSLQSFSAAGTPRKRPTSLSMWQHAPGAHPSHYPTRDANGDLPPPTPEQRTSAMMNRLGSSNSSAGPDEHETLGLVELQTAFENLHSVRRGLLWRLLSMADRKLADSCWLEAGGVLEELTRSLQLASQAIAQAVEAEFGVSGLGSDSLDISRRVSKRASVLIVDPPTPPVGHRGHSRSQSATQRARPTSWNSPTSAGSRPLSLSFPASFSIHSTPPPASRPQHPRPSSASALFPPNFAPANPHSSLGPTAALATFDARAQEMALALRSIAAKLHVVTEDAKRHVESPSSSPTRPSTSLERTISTHDSIRADLDALSREWDNSRLALRQLVRPSPSLGPASVDDSYAGSDGIGGGNFSLDSIADDEDDDGASQWSSEIRTPESTPPRPSLREETSAFEDAQQESYLPTPGDEQVFEAVAEQAEGRREMSKLSREDRIKAMKESRRESRGNSGSGSSAGGGSMKTQAGMVAELKDVLVLLKGRRHLPADV
ncbi:hypothetical protein RQP46_002924 [Phenoliferia psychrophenolica]